jgi:hypothetical protein
MRKIDVRQAAGGTVSGGAVPGVGGRGGERDAAASGSGMLLGDLIVGRFLSAPVRERLAPFWSRSSWYRCRCCSWVHPGAVAGWTSPGAAIGAAEVGVLGTVVLTWRNAGARKTVAPGG